MELKVVQEELIQVIDKAVKHSVKMYLPCEIQNARVDFSQEEQKFSQDIISFISLSGGLDGTLSLYLTTDFALRIARQMFGEDMIDENSESEILDTVAELNNVVVGTLKNLMASHAELHFDMSTPKVVHASSQIEVHENVKHHQVVCHYDVEGEDLLVVISLNASKFATSDSSLEGKKVLLVDDDSITVDILSKILESIGAQCFVARDGEEAVGVAESHQGEFALILMDIFMPKMGGVEAAGLIREVFPKIPIRFMSSYSEKHLPNNLSELDHKNLLKKPITKEKFLQKLEIYS